MMAVFPFKKLMWLHLPFSAGASADKGKHAPEGAVAACFLDGRQAPCALGLVITPAAVLWNPGAFCGSTAPGKADDEALLAKARGESDA